jgi:integrase
VERELRSDTAVPVLAKGKCRTGRVWTYVRDDRPFAGTTAPAPAFFYSADRKPGDFLFAGRGGDSHSLTTRQYARLVGQWIAIIGLAPLKFGTHSLRRTEATLVYRRTGNLRAVQLLLGHSKVECTVRYLGIEIDDAIEIAKKSRSEVQGQSCRRSVPVPNGEDGPTADSSNWAARWR